MSWQAYIDSNLVGAGLAQAMIIDNKAGGTWATSAGFALKPNEATKIVQNFADPSKFTAEGTVLGGKKYMTLKADNRSVYAKLGAGGAVLVKTGQAILIGLYDDKLQPGAASQIVEKLGDYLVENNY
ncbi:profilin I [Tieghemostelium lacteum]|uniref:Profilin n=1 Tax=Tieghemostelium lacteum TaxID=361077 RepID=A0A151ZT18_TIELA|nr:profilin I [Tieghemostelium lacteum]|eukprot:KYQ96924.1 profilin I [Tieghemostelium lacteum]